MITAAHARPVVSRDGYLPIEDHGLIGDGSTCALVGRDGAITWLCLPEFDSPPFLAGLLDAEYGGRFEIAPINTLASLQRYVEDSCVLVTSFVSDRACSRSLTALTLRSGADLVRAGARRPIGAPAPCAGGRRRRTAAHHLDSEGRGDF